jgi:hypothetical protein
MCKRNYSRRRKKYSIIMIIIIYIELMIYKNKITGIKWIYTIINFFFWYQINPWKKIKLFIFLEIYKYFFYKYSHK